MATATAHTNGVNGVNGHSHKTNGTHKVNEEASYSVLSETQSALASLLRAAKSQIPPEITSKIQAVEFTNAHTGVPDFPVPLKENEATSALKAVEAGLASAVADLALGEQETQRRAVVDLERASCFLFSTYLATVGGFDKGNPKAKALLKGISMNPLRTQYWRRSCTNVYICLQTPISSPPNQTSTAGSQPTCTKPKMQVPTSTCTAPSKPPPRSTWSGYPGTTQT